MQNVSLRPVRHVHPVRPGRLMHRQRNKSFADALHISSSIFYFYIRYLLLKYNKPSGGLAIACTKL